MFGANRSSVRLAALLFVVLFVCGCGGGDTPPLGQVTGTVTLDVTVREDGTVGFARVVACTRQGVGFEKQAMLAVREWLYQPAPLGTGPRGVTVTIDFRRDEVRP